MKKVDGKYFKNPERYVPEGIYCYNEKGICPFWDIDETKEVQENGYCHLLKQGDFDFEHFGLLWDKCKECGVNDSLEYEIEHAIKE